MINKVFALYHVVLISLLIYWFWVKETSGVCFIGTLLLYTQQWWLAERRNDATQIHEPPSVQPESHYDEWCYDCKEYDQEKHRCPRYNKVIRTALQRVQPKREKVESDDIYMS